MISADETEVKPQTGAFPTQSRETINNKAKESVMNQLSEVQSNCLIFLEAFLHQKSHDKVRFMFLHVFPNDFNTAVTTVWPQSEIR